MREKIPCDLMTKQSFSSSNCFRSAVVFLTIVLITVLCFWSSMHGEFAFDDHLALLNNKDTLHVDNSFWSTDFLSHDFWGASLSSSSSHKSYRPVTIITWRFLRHFSRQRYGSDVSTCFHGANICIHILNVFLVSLVVHRFVTIAWLPVQEEDDRVNSMAYAISSLTALLFTVHPVHTEAICGIVGFADLLSVSFSLMAFLAWNRSINASIEAMCHGNTTISSLQCCTPRSIAWCLLSIVLLTLSTLSKEVGITTVAICIIADFLTILPRYLRTEVDVGGSIVHLRFSIGCVFFLRVMLLVGCVASYLWLRIQLSGSAITIGNEVFRAVENPIAFLTDPTSIWLSIIHLHYRYVILLLFPRTLSVDYSFNCIPVVLDASDSRIIAPLILYISLSVWLTIAIVRFVRDLCRRDSLNGYQEHIHAHRTCLIISFYIFLMPFIPASNVLFYIGTTIAERLLYAPSIGFCFAVAVLLHRVWAWPSDNSLSLGSANSTRLSVPIAPELGLLSKDSDPSRHIQRRLVFCIIFIVAILGCSRTIGRNKDWQTEGGLFKAALEVCPSSVKVLQNCGILERRSENWSGAMRYFNEVVKIDPSFCEVHYWIALTQINSGELHQGIRTLRRYSLECIYSRNNAASLLERIYIGLIDIGGEHASRNVSLVVEWADIMSQLGQHASACAQYISAGEAFYKSDRYVLSLMAFGRACTANRLNHEVNITLTTTIDINVSDNSQFQQVQCNIDIWRARVQLKLHHFSAALLLLKHLVRICASTFLSHSTGEVSVKLQALDLLASHWHPRLLKNQSDPFLHSLAAFTFQYLNQSQRAAEHYLTASKLHQMQRNYSMALESSRQAKLQHDIPRHRYQMALAIVESLMNPGNDITSELEEDSRKNMLIESVALFKSCLSSSSQDSELQSHAVNALLTLKHAGFEIGSLP